MTDEIDPATLLQPAPPTSPAPAATRRRGGGRQLLVLLVLVGFLAVVLYMVKDNTSANDLKVGDCFDIPTATAVQAVTQHPCTDPHTAEVFLVADYNGTAMDTPITLNLDEFVGATCDPAFTAYVGKALDDSPELSIGYLYPDDDAWKSGNRSITCYVANTDESSMSSSLKASAAP